MSPAALADSPWLPRPFRIAAKRQESTDVFSFELEAADSFAFLPGQFNMLYAFGKGEVPISISGGAPAGARLLHTIRNVGKITADLCAREPGELIELRGPYGSAWPVAGVTGRDVVVVAGGIGLAPVRPVIHALLENRGDYGSVSVLYGARTPDDLIFRDEIAALRAGNDIDFRVTVDFAPREWPGSVGMVTSLIDALSFRPGQAAVMICGPEIMMRHTADEFLNRGVGPGDIYLSMERNMKCAIGFCGHCLYGPHFICRDGPVFRFDQVGGFLRVREL